jgi:hypothetical protein
MSGRKQRLSALFIPDTLPPILINAGQEWRMFEIGISGREGDRIGYLSVNCIAASLLWFESTEIWDEVQSVDRFGYKWQMMTMALVGSAHPTFRRKRMAGHIADKIRSLYPFDR